ncbi:MAG TPA: protein kinase [Kofleriaceae bacterium]|nr:protein kinase [Kofleriaceae bacterium]
MDHAASERRGETTRLGSFEIVRRLARGGMAEIFLARTRGPSGFEKLVVLKKILPKYAGRPRFVQLFLDEAKLAASLDHPNIAQVYDIGMVDGSYFFTMEYLHGQDVRSILHRTWRTGGQFPIEHAVQIARHVASALHFAHEKRRADGSLLGIVHRDVSPSNIIVTYDGATKLLDFGVAKTTASSVKTRTGALKGKVAYMSPEQARGLPIDRRSDIFALGIVLWEMVTTQRLYRGENDLATLQLITTQPPRSPRKVRPACPAELERIVLRALADDPDARYQTAEQLVTELDELAREHKLKQSTNALSATLGQLFGDELAAWREAREAGVPLADHLHEARDMTTPITDSDFLEPDPGIEDDDDLEDLEDDDDLTEHHAPIEETSSVLPGALGAEPSTVLGVEPPTVLGVEPPANLGAELPTVLSAEPVTPIVEPSPYITATQLDPPPGILEPSSSELEPLPTELEETVLSPANAAARTRATPGGGFPSGARKPEGTPLPGVRHPTPGALPVFERRHPTPGTLPTLERRHPTGPQPIVERRPPTGPQPRIDRRPQTPPSGAPGRRTLTPGNPLPVVEHRPPGTGAPVPPPNAVPSAILDHRHDAPSAPLPALGAHPAGSMPLATMVPPPVASVPFVPPWQSGQPGPAASPGAVTAEPARTERPWAIVDLPPFDPEQFERQRRLVVRIAAGLVAAVIVLALIAGHC